MWTACPLMQVECFVQSSGNPSTSFTHGPYLEVGVPLLVAWVRVRPPSSICASLYEPVCLSASHDAPPHLQPGEGTERGHCSCHSEACCMHLWHRVGEIIPIIPLECLWINQFCVNKCRSLADLQSPLVTNVLVYKERKAGLYTTRS